MAASWKDISGWFDEGLQKKAAFMLVACDRFDYTDYPAFAMDVEELRKKLKELNRPNEMSTVEEVYDLSLPKEPQLNEHMTWHVPNPL